MWFLCHCYFTCFPHRGRGPGPLTRVVTYGWTVRVVTFTACCVWASAILLHNFNCISLGNILLFLKLPIGETYSGPQSLIRDDNV